MIIWTEIKEQIPTQVSNLKSAFTAYLADSNHACTNLTNKLEVLHTFKKKGRYHDSLEDFDIYKAIKVDPQNLINKQFQSYITFNTAIKLM